MPSNIEALSFIDKYVQYFSTGMGGLDLNAIAKALELEDKFYLLDRVSIYMRSSLIERSRKRDPVKQFKNKRGKK